MKIHHKLNHLIFILPALLILQACRTSQEVHPAQMELKSISGLKYINTYVIPYDLQFKGTTVGGLSAIDYDPVRKNYYLVCDDRSAINPARFYTATISIGTKGIDGVTFTAVDTLKQQDGSAYPKLSRHETKTTDPEAMRYNGITHYLTWTSEGERIITPQDTLLIDPTIRIVDTTGKYIDTIPLPDNLRMHTTDSGPIKNGVLEGLTFADNFKTLYINLEEPLHQDGPRAGLKRNGAFVRFFRFDVKTKKNTAQYAYELDPVDHAPAKPADEINNGIPDILWLGGTRFMVTERSFSGSGNPTIKVFLTDIQGVDNIIALPSIKEKPVAHPMVKHLLINMDTLKIPTDNIEGATLGPVLANGHQSVIFVADNNFREKQKAQFILFEVIP